MGHPFVSYKSDLISEEVMNNVASKKKNRYFEILAASTKLGLTSFGGPAAHIGYFREEYVQKRKWLDDKLYADLVALCQFLPGPASSQVGISIGMLRGGLLGGILSWIGFTLPSVLLLMAFAWIIMKTGSFESGWIQGLKIVAVAVVAHALMGMGKTLTPDRTRITVAIIAAASTLLIPTVWGQIIIIVLIFRLLINLDIFSIKSFVNLFFSKTCSLVRGLIKSLS